MSSPTKLRQMAKELGWPPELEKAADQLQKLKRENAALREAHEKQVAFLMAEVAALRADKERLDWLGFQKDQPWLYWERPLRLTREAIDAFRKEAQP